MALGTKVILIFWDKKDSTNLKAVAFCYIAKHCMSLLPDMRNGINLRCHYMNFRFELLSCMYYALPSKHFVLYQLEKHMYPACTCMIAIELTMHMPFYVYGRVDKKLKTYEISYTLQVLECI